MEVSSQVLGRRNGALVCLGMQGWVRITLHESRMPQNWISERICIEPGYTLGVVSPSDILILSRSLRAPAQGPVNKWISE